MDHGSARSTATSTISGVTANHNSLDGRSPATGTTTRTSFSSFERSAEFSLLEQQKRQRSLRPSVRETNSLKEFTINKLNFDKLDLYGRDEERQILQQAFEELQFKNIKHLVLLSGYSGVGKTCLARTLQEQTQTQGGLYAEGKFDLRQSHAGGGNNNKEPYSAMATVCGMICAKVLSTDQSQQICREIVTALGPEIQLLLRTFPILEEIFSDQEIQGVTTTTTATTTTTKWTCSPPNETKFRLNFAFCRFMRLICRQEQLSPVILVLDDLQWADVPSMDLMDDLLSDREAKLMMIGIYRSNEVHETHCLMTCLRELQVKSSRACDSFVLQEVSVGNLELPAIVRFLGDLFSAPESESLPLASLCLKRTQGNVFHLIRFLEHLYQKELIHFNFGMLKWTWNDQEIEQKTVASENVVDLLLEKMHNMPPQNSNILRLAACLGSSFDEKTLLQLWKSLYYATAASNDREEDTKESIECQVESALNTCVSDGFIFEENHRGQQKGNYAFVHDKIQEAANLLTPENDKHFFHKRVGQVMLENFKSGNMSGPSIFVIVNLLNEGDLPTDDRKRRELAELNCRACTLSMEMSAFEACSGYASMGIRLLHPGAFTDGNCKLAVELHSTGAAAESSLGNIKTMEEYCHTVIRQSIVSIEDKLRVYTVWIDSLGNRGEMKQAVDETLTLLRKFGVSFPRSRMAQSAQTLWKILRVKKGLQGGLLTKIVSLPFDNDPVRQKLLHLMDRLSVYLYYLHDDLMPLVMFRNLQWTLQYGLNNITPAALTTMGIIFAGIMGELQEGSKCAQAALDLIPKVSPQMEGRILFVAHLAGVTWTQTMREQLKPLQRGYEAGLCAGDKESACWAIYVFILIRFLSSFSLDLVIADVEVYMPQMCELNQLVTYRTTVANYQMFMNLAGRTKTDHCSLVGDYLTADNHDTWSKEDPFYYKSQCKFWKCFIYTIYGEHEACAKLAIEYGPHDAVKTNPGAFVISLFEVIAKGTSSFVAARTSPNRKSRKKYKKNALSIRRRVKNWIEQGNLNVAHLSSFFDAEYAALRGKRYKAIQNYQNAITIAGRGGLSMEAGLFSETFGEFLLWQECDRDEARFRLSEAIKFYGDFGALQKVQLLESKHRKLLSPESMEIAVME